MKPKYHFIASAVLAVLLFPFFERLSLLVFVFGFLIDFDHYFYFAVKEKKLNPLKTYKMLIECIDKLEFDSLRKDELHFLHTIEVWTAVAVLSFLIGKAGIPLFAGLAVHVAMDFIWGQTLQRKGINVKGIRANSLLFWIARRLKKKGKKAKKTVKKEELKT